jgi:hypothetical protein
VRDSKPVSRVYAVFTVYIGGAVLYFLLLEAGGVTFDVTPLFFGAVMLVASPFRPRLLASAVMLGAWGVAVLLVRHGPLPDDREAPAFLTACGLGLAALLALRRWVPAEIAVESATAVLIVGGLAFYFTYDVEAFARAWPWAVALALNAAGLVLVEAWRARRTTGNADADGANPRVRPYGTSK